MGFKKEKSHTNNLSGIVHEFPVTLHLSDEVPKVGIKLLERRRGVTHKQPLRYRARIPRYTPPLRRKFDHRDREGALANFRKFNHRDGRELSQIFENFLS